MSQINCPSVQLVNMITSAVHISTLHWLLAIYFNKRGKKWRWHSENISFFVIRQFKMPVELLKYYSHLNITFTDYWFQLVSYWAYRWLGGEQSTRQCSRRGFDPRAREDLVEEETATHSSIAAWRIPWTGKAGELQSTGSQRVRHDWMTKHEIITSALLYYPNIQSVIFHPPQVR